MKPVEFPWQNETLAKNQPPYKPLPVYIGPAPNSVMISCWRFSLWERIKVLWTGKLWLAQYTFEHRLQPQLPTVHESIVLTLE